MSISLCCYFRVTDLIVAAPFYFNKAEGGAVYVYTALDICRTMKDNEKCLPVKLVGREESRFDIFLYRSCPFCVDTKYVMKN